MPSASQSVTVNRRASEVFAFVADGENALNWRSGVLDIQRVSGHGVGAVYRQGVRGPGRRRVAADYEVTAYEPDKRMAFIIGSLLRLVRLWWSVHRPSAAGADSR